LSSEDVELGPIDIVVIGYPPGAPRTGEAMPLFLDLVDRGIIRVLDVLAVEKDADGVISGFEITDVDGDGENDLAVFAGASSGLLGDEDANAAGAEIEPGSAALLICYENRWAAPFAAAIRRNGGEVLAFHRVGAQDLADTIEALEAADAAS
jgi:Family of unknown function (DUF6325)